jgi:hypothetical protein
MIGVELAPHVLDEPSQDAVRAADQRHHPLPGTAAASAFAEADVQLAEPAQLPFDVGQIQIAGFVHT